MTRRICTQNKADRAVQASPSAKARTLVFSNLFGLSMQCKEMKQVKLIKCILLLAMGIAVLGCSNSEFEKHRVVDLTELVPHEGRIEIPLSIVEEAQRLIDEGLILPHEQIVQAPGGATTKKSIYKFYYHYAYNLGIALEKPTLEPKYVEDKNGHILPYVNFVGGELRITEEALNVLDRTSNDRQ